MEAVGGALAWLGCRRDGPFREFLVSLALYVILLGLCVMAFDSSLR